MPSILLTEMDISFLTFQWECELKDKFDERFKRIKGADLDSYSMNQWLENKQVITSLDLAKRAQVLPGLRQVRWDLVIIDEAHRMSASDPEHKTLRYRLGELLRDTSDHFLLLTATPHKGDPVNFNFFLQLLDEDAYADVRSIHEAMGRRRAPFYLRRTKEAMVYFPERQLDGTWVPRKIFTKRIPHTVDFGMDGKEFDLYRDVTRYVKQQSARAAVQGDDPRARAVGFLMSLYQRRLASSTYAMRRSLENRVKRLQEGLRRAQELLRSAPPELPDPEELEEMEEIERERLESLLEAMTIAHNSQEIQEEIENLNRLANEAKEVEDLGIEAKLSRLKEVLQREGFFGDPEKRLLIFTEFRDTLEDDAVFNVVGEILPAAYLERVLRDYYAGHLDDADLEDRLLRDVKEERFPAICQNALEGLAAKKLNLEMLIERRARAQERRVVPETIARFIREVAGTVPYPLKPVSGFQHTFAPATTPQVLRRIETEPDWKFPPLANRYPRFSTDRETADRHSLEWVTPGHSMFESLRRYALVSAQEPFSRGACFYSLSHDKPVRLDFYRARIVDGLGQVIHERVFAIEINENSEPKLYDPGILGNLQPATSPDPLPFMAHLPEAQARLNDHALQPFMEEVRTERIGEIEQIARHVEISLTELIQKADELIGRFAEATSREDEGARGLLAQAEGRHQELLLRRGNAGVRN